MLLLPYSTDAPIYHWPITTVSLIVTNIVVFCATIGQVYVGNIEAESLEWLLLDYSTINPLQWVTGAFMHADPFHLMGNMFFLWAFGLVVEGKIGNSRFLAIYMTIAVAESALEQTLLFVLVGEGMSLGASSAVFGVMVIALLWAPENDIECFYWFIVLGTFEVSIVKLAGVFLFLQIVSVYLSPMSVSSGLLHLMGAAIGAPIGWWMLRNQSVDCENWDLISRNEWLHKYEWLCSQQHRQRLQNRETDNHDPIAAALAAPHSHIVSSAAAAGARASMLTTPKKQSVAPASATTHSAAPTVVAKASGRFGRRKSGQPEPAPTGPTPTSHPEFNRLSMLLRQTIASGSGMLALQHFGKLEQMGLTPSLSDATLMGYVRLLAAQKNYLAALRPLELIVAHAESMSDDARLRIAQIQLKVQSQPDRAAATLRQIQTPSGNLTPQQIKLLQTRDQLLARCGGGQHS